METVSGVDRAKCIKCGKCVRVCPSEIFAIEADGVVLHDPATCIGCGHCVGVCPEDAVIHPLFPEGKMHRIDHSQMPTPDQVMLLSLARRSNRAFARGAVPAASLEMIARAASAAPTASNSRNLEFTLVTDPAALQKVIDLGMLAIRHNYKLLKNPLLKPILKRTMPDVVRYVPVFERIIKRHAEGGDPILRTATALMLITTPEKSRFGEIDASLAYQNGSLMAESLGVSQFYTGFLITAIKMYPGKLEKMLGIEGRIKAGMALGMPAVKFVKYFERGDQKITSIN